MSGSIPDEQHLRIVVNCMLAGAVIPFLGAGANLCGRGDNEPWKGRLLPSGRDLAAELKKPPGYPDPKNEDHDLMRISQYFYATMGAPRLYEEIRKPLLPLCEPTALHEFLAQMSRLLGTRNERRQVILTTNYDDALERAFDALDPPEPYDLIWYEAKGTPPDCGRFVHQRHGEASPVTIELPNRYDELVPDERTVIIKLHGAMVRSDATRDSYVITEDDYIRYLAGPDVASQLPAVLRQRISEANLLFLGYSMRDWNLRVVLERLGGDAVLSGKDWSVQRRPGTDEETQIEETLWDLRKVDLRFILLDEYVDRLYDEIAGVRAAEEQEAEEEKARVAAAQALPPVQKRPRRTM